MTRGVVGAMLAALLATTPASALLLAQGTSPAAPLVLLSRDGRRPLPTTLLGGQELIALDDAAAAFQLTVREDALAGGVTVSYKGRSVVLSADQPMASVNGRLVALPAPLVRAGKRSLVPVEFLSRALAPIYDARLELRKASRLVLLGDVRVPRISARVESPGPPTRVVIDVTPSAPVSATIEAARVVLQVDADALDTALPVSGSGFVEQIRAGDQPGAVIVSLRVGAGSARVVPTTTDAGTRITIEIPQAGAAAPPPAPVATAATTAAAADSPLFPARNALQTIVIDPGHGGEDAGVTGAGEIREKDVALEVGKRLKALIENRLGIRVLLTRDDDRMVRLDERAAMANNSKANLFLSLHANGALAPSVAGAEIFYLSVDQEVEEVRRASQSEGANLMVVGGGTRALNVIRWDMAQARHIETSAVLASMLEETLRTRVPMGPRAIQRAPLRVLVGADMPAAAVEMGYLTNGAQSRQLASPDFQASMAQALYEAIVRFRDFLETQR